jgi:4-alpha-glucanotransferase
MVGTWKKGPGSAVFEALERDLGRVPILAEDLGVITPDVVDLRQAIGAPGMCVTQFAWGGGPTNTHLPHNVYENCFVYPGGWGRWVEQGGGVRPVGGHGMGQRRGSWLSGVAR